MRWPCLFFVLTAVSYFPRPSGATSVHRERDSPTLRDYELARMSYDRELVYTTDLLASDGQTKVLNVRKKVERPFGANSTNEKQLTLVTVSTATTGASECAGNIRTGGI
jgi:hypothetical protein